jgi:hypothetical protein
MIVLETNNLSDTDSASDSPYEDENFEIDEDPVVDDVSSEGSQVYTLSH